LLHSKSPDVAARGLFGSRMRADVAIAYRPWPAKAWSPPSSFHYI
jgi:hypothetical protein